MSTDWDIRCVDCGENYGFEDMNRREGLMLALVRCADALAQHANVFADLRSEDVELRVSYPDHVINLEFFQRHRGHRLSPVDEYGRLSDNCSGHAACASCGKSHPCALIVGHAGDHKAPVKS